LRGHPGGRTLRRTHKDPGRGKKNKSKLEKLTRTKKDSSPQRITCVEGAPVIALTLRVRWRRKEGKEDLITKTQLWT